MQLINEREILFFDLKPKTISRKFKNLQPLDAKFLFIQLEKLFKKGTAFRQIKNKTETLYIADIQCKDNLAQILINRSDKNVTDVVFSDVEKKKRRVIKKEDGEGNDYSAHIVWTLERVDGLPDTYLFLLELSPGLGSRKIESFINYLLRKAKKDNPRDFSIKSPEGNVDSKGRIVKINVSYKIELHGHISDQFKEELERGRITFLELYTPKHNIPFDDYSYTTERKKALQLTISNSGKLASKISLIKSICNRASSEGLEYLKVRFVTNENINRTAHIYTNTANLASDFLFIKKKRITNLSNAFLSSYDRLNDEIISNMIRLLR